MFFMVITQTITKEIQSQNSQRRKTLNSFSRDGDTNAMFNREAIYVLVFQGSQINTSFGSSYSDWDGSAAALIKAF